MTETTIPTKLSARQTLAIVARGVLPGRHDVDLAIDLWQAFWPLAVRAIGAALYPLTVLVAFAIARQLQRHNAKRRMADRHADWDAL